MSPQRFKLSTSRIWIMSTTAMPTHSPVISLLFTHQFNFKCLVSQILFHSYPVLQPLLGGSNSWCENNSSKDTDFNVCMTQKISTHGIWVHALDYLGKNYFKLKQGCTIYVKNVVLNLKDTPHKSCDYISIQVHLTQSTHMTFTSFQSINLLLLIYIITIRLRPLNSRYVLS
jgi:hypothetical protein